MDLQGVLRGSQILAIFLIAQIGRSSQQSPWVPAISPAMASNPAGRFVSPTGNSPVVEGIIQTRADYGGLQTMTGFGNNFLPNGWFPPNPAAFGLTNTFIPGGQHTSIPHTYNGRRRNYRVKRAVPRARAQANWQNQPRGQGRRAGRPQARNAWRQNNQAPLSRGGRRLRPGRWRRKNQSRRQNPGKGRQQTQNVEIEREGTAPARRQQNTRRPWRRNRPGRRHPTPLQRWNPTPTRPTSPPTTTPAMWQQPQTTAPSVWQPSLFDWFSGWFPGTTVPPPVYVPPPATPGSVEHSKKHGVCYCYNMPSCPSDLSLAATECDDGQIMCCED